MWPKGRRLSGETRIKEVSFQMFPERNDREAIFYLEGERVPKSRCVMTEGIRKMFV